MHILRLYSPIVNSAQVGLNFNSCAVTHCCAVKGTHVSRERISGVPRKYEVTFH